jgi:serine/threonine protein kinase/uncharacterized MAPEG superfamily protein
MRSVDKACWLQLSPLLDEFLDLPIEERAARLQQLRSQGSSSAELAANAELADDLQELLARQDAMENANYLASPALPQIPDAAPEPVNLAGQTVGTYTLERQIGQGGMGTVWLARRTDGRFEGQVAIKFLNTGLLGQGGAQRFAREGQILARLAHPHIARLLDAGIANDAGGGGQPYLVLEYVDGLPLDRYCQDQALDIHASVRLFLDVLAAVAHAHNRLILHRDLKPSNILVTAAGEVKLLDFGIAKLLDDSSPTETGVGAAASELTRQAGRAFTPRFAAPEQVEGGDVTTATDVYALGVLLYLLLCGQHPTTEAAPDATLLERIRTVVEVQPRRLSERLRGAGGKLNTQRARELRGDLDTIVACALKKAPAERYPNASALADDLRRWLAHEPIKARPDSVGYRFKKFIRRHRVGVATGSFAALALLTGIGVALWKAQEAHEQRVQAEGLIEFMLVDLRQKLEPVGRLDALDVVGEKALSYYAAQQISQLDPDSLGRRARALHLMGEMAEKRGKLDEASRLFGQAAQTTAELLARAPQDGQRLFDHAQSAYWVGYVAKQRGQLPESMQQFQAYLALAKQLALAYPAQLEWQKELGHANSNLGVLLIDQLPESALVYFQAAQAVWQRLVAAAPEVRFYQANSLGWTAKAHGSMGNYAAALAAEQQKLAVLNSMPDAATNRRVQHLVGNAYYESGRMQFYLGDTAAALANTRQAVALMQALVDSDSSNLEWLGQFSVLRLGLIDIQTAHAQQTGQTGASSTPDPRQSLRKLTADMARLMAADANKLEWHCNLPARLLLASLPYRSDTELQTAAQRFLAEMQLLTDKGRIFKFEQANLIASVEVMLGDLLAHQPAAQAQARLHWQAAAARLQTDSDSKSNFRATALWGQAKFHLNEFEAAQAAAAKVAASTLRHPDYLKLQRLLERRSAALN